MLSDDALPCCAPHTSVARFFEGGREQLWEEKLGMRPRFQGNEATQWGTNNEATALREYEGITGQRVIACGFKACALAAVQGNTGPARGLLLGGKWDVV